MNARPFRLTVPLPLELDIHEAVASALDKLLLPPAVWCCYPAGHIKLSAAEAARLSRCGLKRSWPDILIVYYGLWGLELKRRGGKLSQDRITRTRKGSPRLLEGQATTFPKLIAAGFASIEVAHNVDEALLWIQRWGIPLRGRIAA